MTKHLVDAMTLQRLRFLINGGFEPSGKLEPGTSTSQARWNLFSALGIPYKGGKIPHDLEGSYELDGFTFKLYRGWSSKHPESSAKTFTPAEARAGYFSNRAHRLYFLCPVCPAGALIPIGRFGQHVQVHTNLADSTAAQITTVTTSP